MLVLQAIAQASCRTSHTALDVKMGLRDNLKKVGATVAAGLSFAMMPGAARAMDTVVQPRLMLPSQEAYQNRPADLMSEPDALPIRIVKHPAFAGAVGLAAAGGIGKVVLTQVQKKQTDSMRSMLSSKSGIGIDASILDEVPAHTHTHTHP